MDTMARPRMKHLQFWHGSWRVRQPVLKALQAIIGRGAYLTESLRTPDLREAERRALPVLAKFRAMLDDAQAALDQQQQRRRAFDDLAGLDHLPVENLICPGRNVTGVLTRFHDVLGVEQPNGHVADGPVPFASMIPKWAKFGNKGEKAVEDMTTKCGKFMEWLEHDDMAAVIFEDGRDWRDEMIEDGDLSPKSISNHLKAVKALFAYAYDNKHITVGPNPMLDVKFNPGDGRKRDDFTIEERRKILLAARDAEDDIKWLTFLSHYVLARTSEIADAHTRDIVCEDGVWLMKIEVDPVCATAGAAS
jgi:hypothetical protein